MGGASTGHCVLYRFLVGKLKETVLRVHNAQHCTLVVEETYCLVANYLQSAVKVIGQPQGLLRGRLPLSCII